MLFQGQEILEDEDFRDTDPVDWSNLLQFAGSRDLYADLIVLRRNAAGVTAGLQGQQVNVMEPMIAHSILESQTMLNNASQTLREHCVAGVKANRDVCLRFVERSIGIVTALNPLIGYEKATELAAEALRTGKGIGDLVREKKLLDEDVLAPAFELAWTPALVHQVIGSP